MRLAKLAEKVDDWVRARVRVIQNDDELGLGLGLFQIMNEVEEVSRESRELVYI